MPLSKAKAVERIHLLLDDRDWEDGVSILHEIADIIRETGLTVRAEGDAPTRWLIANQEVVGQFWSDEDAWGPRETATVFGEEDRRKRVLPAGSFWMTPQHYEDLTGNRGRTEQLVNNATIYISDHTARGYFTSWRRLSTDERGENGDAEFEIVWPTTPEHPTSLTVQYTLQEANDLVNELAGQGAPRSSLMREYQRRFGPLPGEQMARKVQYRSLAIPRSQRIAEWDWAQDDNRPTFTAARFYEPGLVVEVTYEGRTLSIHREGVEEIRRLDPESGNYVALESHAAADLRELFPQGRLDDDCDRWRDAHFTVYEGEDAYDSPYDLSQALSMAANRVGGVALPEVPTT